MSDYSKSQTVIMGEQETVGNTPTVSNIQKNINVSGSISYLKDFITGVINQINKVLTQYSIIGKIRNRPIEIRPKINILYPKYKIASRRNINNLYYPRIAINQEEI